MIWGGAVRLLAELNDATGDDPAALQQVLQDNLVTTPPILLALLADPVLAVVHPGTHMGYSTRLTPVAISVRTTCSAVHAVFLPDLQ